MYFVLRLEFALSKSVFLGFRQENQKKKKGKNSAGVSESSIHTSHPIPKNLRADKGE